MCVSNKKILSHAEYLNISNFILHFDGLTIDCELEMSINYPSINHLTLRSILQTEVGNRVRAQSGRYECKGKALLNLLAKNPATVKDANEFVVLAKAIDINPIIFSRTILLEKYKLESKSQLSRFLKYPHLIDDPFWSTNVVQCLCSDNQDGPLVDLMRRVVGEEYELKLKRLARSLGIHYYDESDLRRLGYDKTPDIKTILPFLYKGDVVNWIESKAVFGDIKTHKRYTQLQLSSYSNRFGPGIVIYWFGYDEKILELTDSSLGITVLHDFPENHDIQLLDIDTQ